MQPIVNHVLRVAIYDIKGTILGKSVRNNSAYNGLVDQLRHFFLKLCLKSFFCSSLSLLPVKIKDVIN